MRLISKSLIDNKTIKYYEGIDLHIIDKHSKTGEDGFMVCFIQNWKNEVRNEKINNIIDNTYSLNINDINNSYVMIYQADNTPILNMYEIIKEKIEVIGLDINEPWVPVGGITSGALRIGKPYIIN